MPRILVADDNSNIQKMVGLALKDHGIEVVAVGNGEAAVRKISAIIPDLVLADVFMPVRSGYEVCQYVKEDPALAHIPVILLVGAFDPLDEQEAQRVGADGVLKKPFVPPDPLIAMVKSALARAGAASAAATADKARVAPPPKLEEISEPDPASPPARVSVPTTISADLLPEIDAVPFLNSDSAHAQTLSPIPPPSGGPVAFASLLETPPSDEQPSEVAESPYATIGADRDWRDMDEKDDIVEEEEEDTASSWRPDIPDEQNAVPLSAGIPDWRERSFDASPTGDRAHANGLPSSEISSFTESVDAEHAVGAPVQQDAAPFTGEAWKAALEASANERSIAIAEINAPQEMAATPESPAQVEAAHSAPYAAANEMEPAVVENAARQEPSAQPSGQLPASSANSWDAEMQKANRLASTWDASPLPADSANHHEQLPEESSAADVAQASSPQVPAEAPISAANELNLPPAALEAFREEAVHAAQDATHGVSTCIAENVVETPAAADSSTDDVVAKVLARMSPEMLQAVTREILKPVVAAMIREEMNKK